MVRTYIPYGLLVLESDTQSGAGNNGSSSADPELKEWNSRMSAFILTLELVTPINPSLKKCTDEVKNFFEKMVIRNIQALNKIKLLP